MKLEITVEGMSEEAERIILRTIKTLIFDYRVEEGLKKTVKVKEVNESFYIKGNTVVLQHPLGIGKEMALNTES